jgi:hypothetical protein
VLEEMEHQILYQDLQLLMLVAAVVVGGQDMEQLFQQDLVDQVAVLTVAQMKPMALALQQILAVEVVVQVEAGVADLEVMVAQELLY